LDERERFVRATLTGALFASAVGMLAFTLAGRPAAGLAFAIGAGISLINFRLIAKAVGSLDLEAPRAGWGELWKGGLVRFGIAGGVLFLALVVVRVSFLPLVAGLLLAQLWMLGHWLWTSLRAGG
jgi:hypothetical protein